MNYEHIPAELVAHVIRAAAACDVAPLLELRAPPGLESRCGEDHLPGANRLGNRRRAVAMAVSGRALPRRLATDADWVVLDGVGHCPQLDVPLDTAELILGFTASVEPC